MDVRDKVVVITGAARGIGQEFARSLAAAGAHIVAADINDCSATLGLVEAQGAKAIGVTLDVRDAISAAGMATAATRAFGHIDALNQQCRPLWRVARRPLRRHRRGGLGRCDGGQCQRHLELLQSGGAGHA
jgi:hypothetical protein